MPALTAQDIASIVPGILVRRAYNGRAGNWQPVRSIHARGTSIKGKAYVCGYTQFTPSVNGQGGSEMSFSVTEGEDHIEIQRP